MDLQKQKQAARQRLSSIEEAQTQSILDIESLGMTYPKGFSMYNQAEPWPDFALNALEFEAKGQSDTFVLTGLMGDTITAFNKNKSEFTKISPLHLPFEVAPRILNELLSFLTPIENV